MPVCEKTISKSVKYSQDNPWERGQRKRNKVPFTQFFRDPAEQIENDEGDMKDEEKNIRNLIKYQVFHKSEHQSAMDQISNYSTKSRNIRVGLILYVPPSLRAGGLSICK